MLALHATNAEAAADFLDNVSSQSDAVPPKKKMKIEVDNALVLADEDLMDDEELSPAGFSKFGRQKMGKGPKTGKLQAAVVPSKASAKTSAKTAGGSNSTAGYTSAGGSNKLAIEKMFLLFLGFARGISVGKMRAACFEILKVMLDLAREAAAEFTTSGDGREAEGTPKQDSLIKTTGDTF